MPQYPGEPGQAGSLLIAVKVGDRRPTTHPVSQLKWQVYLGMLSSFVVVPGCSSPTSAPGTHCQF
jgi:hypothetical protein